MRIDILMGMADLEFGPAWERREMLDFDGAPAPFVSRDDLIIAKQASRRLMDRVDLKRLMRVRETHPKRAD